MRGFDVTELKPDLHFPNLRLHEFYDNKLGEGYFESKYPVAEKNVNAFAKPWEWEMYNYGP